MMHQLREWIDTNTCFDGDIVTALAVLLFGTVVVPAIKRTVQLFRPKATADSKTFVKLRAALTRPEVLACHASSRPADMLTSDGNWLLRALDPLTTRSVLKINTKAKRNETFIRLDNESYTFRDAVNLLELTKSEVAKLRKLAKVTATNLAARELIEKKATSQAKFGVSPLA